MWARLYRMSFQLYRPYRCGACWLARLLAYGALSVNKHVSFAPIGPPARSWQKRSFRERDKHPGNRVSFSPMSLRRILRTKERTTTITPPAEICQPYCGILFLCQVLARTCCICSGVFPESGKNVGFWETEIEPLASGVVDNRSISVPVIKIVHSN